MSDADIVNQIKVVQKNVAQLRTIVEQFQQDHCNILNLLSGMTSSIGAVQLTVDGIESTTTAIDDNVQLIPTGDIETDIGTIITQLNNMDAQLANIEGGINAIPDSPVFDNLLLLLEQIASSIGSVPPGQSIWGFLQSVTNVDASEATERIKVFGSINGSFDCDINVAIFNCNGNILVTSTVTNADGDFALYAPAGKYILEFSGDEIVTITRNIELIAGTTEFEVES